MAALINCFIFQTQRNPVFFIKILLCPGNDPNVIIQTEEKVNTVVPSAR
jgi:hypothetical protein